MVFVPARRISHAALTPDRPTALGGGSHAIPPRHEPRTERGDAARCGKSCQPCSAAAPRDAAQRLGEAVARMTLQRGLASPRQLGRHAAFCKADATGRALPGAPRGRRVGAQAAAWISRLLPRQGTTAGASRFRTAAVKGAALETDGRSLCSSSSPATRCARRTTSASCRRAWSNSAPGSSCEIRPPTPRGGPAGTGPSRAAMEASSTAGGGRGPRCRDAACRRRTGRTRTGGALGREPGRRGGRCIAGMVLLRWHRGAALALGLGGSRSPVTAPPRASLGPGAARRSGPRRRRLIAACVGSCLPLRAGARPESVRSRFSSPRHFRTPRIVSPPERCAEGRRFSVGFARGLAEAPAEQGPEPALSGPGFSEPGDLADLPARLKAAEILGFLRREGGGVGEINGGSGATGTRLRATAPKEGADVSMSSQRGGAASD